MKAEMKGLVPTLKEPMEWLTKKILLYTHGFQRGSRILPRSTVLCLGIQGATGYMLGELPGPLVLLNNWGEIILY